MIATVTNFGDNLGVQFPKSLLRNVEIYEDDHVEIFVKGKNIIIKRCGNPKHLTTKERIAAFNEIIEQTPLSEIDWGKPQGKEVW